MIYDKRLLQASMLMVFFAALSASAQQDKQRTTNKQNAQTAIGQPAKAAPNKGPQDDGERVFQQHCSRCHTAPDGFSSRISGTVSMHMRVRASLSEREMQALLRFFNP